MYNKEFIFEATNVASKSLKVLEEGSKIKQPTIGADIFSENSLESKLENDGKFFMGLTKLLNESESEKYFETLSVLLESTQDIFIEVNMKPRT